MENTRSSSTSNQYQNKATENFHRLCQLFVTICSELFREVIMSRIDDLRLKLDEYKSKLKNKKECKLFASQKKILYPNPQEKQTDLKDMDLSLLYILLRHICGIPAPENGWGDEQEDSDLSIGACIDRIRVKRNVLFAHAHTGSIDKDSFNHEWGYLKNNIVKIAQECNFAEKYEKEVEKLRTCTLDSSDTKKCLEIIKKMEEEMKMELVYKKEAIKDLQEDSLLLHHLHAVKGGAIDICLTSIKELQDEMKKNSTSIKELQERVDKLEEAPGEKRKRPERSAEKQPKVIFVEDTYVPPSFVNLTSTITVPNLSAINHIAYVKPGNLWVAGDSTLMQIDLAGNLIQTVDDALCYHGCFAVKENGDLFYIGKDLHSIKRKSSVETSTIVDLQDNVFIRCICISQKNGDLLVVTRNDLKTQRHKVVRYDLKENISHVVLDDSIGDPYKAPVYITENRNGDIVVSDQENNAVIVLNSAGQKRFIIKKRNSGFLPCGLATDDTGNILVVEGHKETYIYVFDQDGILTRRLSEKMDRCWGVCLDDKRNLYVGNRKGKIDVYSY